MEDVDSPQPLVCQEKFVLTWWGKELKRLLEANHVF